MVISERVKDGGGQAKKFLKMLLTHLNEWRAVM
jgi:hypothetical protein